MAEENPNTGLAAPAHVNPTAKPAVVQKDERKSAIDKMDEENKSRGEANLAALERQSQSKPTPTQRECDLAKLGLLDHDEKEDDGSGPEQVAATRRQAVPEDPSKYKTRDVTKK